jgi:hypothetical protein
LLILEKPSKQHHQKSPKKCKPRHLILVPLNFPLNSVQKPYKAKGVFTINYHPILMFMDFRIDGGSVVNTKISNTA